MNQAIRELRDRINQRPFRKREGSRATQFAAVDKPALSPLPAERFDLSEWSRARVNIDYHIAFDTNYYSVPYSLVQELVDVRSTPTTIEIFHKSQRVASHLRAHGHGHAVTNAEHRPRSHQAHHLHNRIRDIRQGPDGLLYLLTDEADGALLRIEPAK